MFLLGMPKPAFAQGFPISDDEIVDVTFDYCDPFEGDFCTVESVAAFLPDTNSSEMDVLVGTEISPDLYDWGWDAEADGFIYQDGQQILTGVATGGLVAELQGPPPITFTIDSIYDLFTDSYIDDAFGEFPDQFILPTGVEMSSGLPRLQNINPKSGYVGSSGSVTITGQNLFDPFPPYAVSANITGPGGGQGMFFTSVSGDPPDATHLTFGYTIAQNATPGAYSISLANRFGIGVTSANNAFMVGDATPMVTSVNPNVWNAGTTTSITITGQHFGTSPSLTITGPGVTNSSITSANDTSISATVTVDPSSSGGTATVTVQSNGYGGSGFLGTTVGQSSTGSNTATISPIQPPTPQILFGGSNVAGTTKAVYIGQQIALTGVLPSGYTIKNVSWSGPDPANTVGGYSAVADGVGQVLPMPSQICPTSGNCNFTYYYVASKNGDHVTFSYTLSNNLTGSAQVIFNASGPTGSLVVQPNMLVDGSGVQVLLVGTDPKLSTTGVGASGKSGITFTSNATAPAGTNQSVTWVQLLTSMQTQYININGPFAIPLSPQSGLDNTYPYTNASPTTTNDTPNAALPSIYGEGWESFSAKMFMLWDPGLPSGCTIAKTVQNANGTFSSTASNCTSIPVPLSSVTWHWSGCAINSLANQANGTTWIRSTSNGCPVQTLGTPAAESSFPTWTNTIHN
jgi:hypothetical protein